MTTFPDEYTEVERPLIDQLQALGWQYLAGDTDVPELTERRSFREVLLLGRLHAAIRRLNVDEDGLPWLDDGRVFAAAGELERLGAPKLLEANQLATELLLKGTAVEGDALRHDGKEQTARFIDFVRPERNDFLVVNQFRVDGPGGQRTIIPDLVLFVNGIPLVVIEAKSPAATDPIEAGITQLLRYTNRRGWVTAEEGAEQLFHYNQFLVATCFHQAHVGTIGASYEHYLEWKDTSPVPMAQVAQELGVDHLSSQQTLVAGMLRPAHLLDIVRNFTLFSQAGGKTVKIVARYQQFRAVQEAVRRLLHGQTKAQHGLEGSARRHHLAHPGLRQESHHGLPDPQDAHSAGAAPLQGGDRHRPHRPGTAAQRHCHPDQRDRAPRSERHRSANDPTRRRTGPGLRHHPEVSRAG